MISNIERGGGWGGKEACFLTEQEYLLDQFLEQQQVEICCSLTTSVDWSIRNAQQNLFQLLHTPLDMATYLT